MTRSHQKSRKVTLEAVYRDGVIYPAQPLDIPEDTEIQLTIEVADKTPVSVVGTRAVWSWLASVRSGARALAKKRAWLLFAAAMLVYTATRFIQLPDFPIYFFSDEAIQAILADELIDRGFRDSSGTLFPPYFKNYQVWNLSLSVYVHTLTVALLGKSVVVTRATSALVSLFGTAAVALILKLIFKARFWWLGVLVMVVTPAWFLHSRTAFETVMMVSFYALFLLFYLLYRCRDSSFIFPALIFAAAAFYAYSNGQAVIGLAIVLLTLSDLGYHWQQVRSLIEQRRWQPLVALLTLAIILAVPYLRFRLNYTNDLVYHLRTLDSYWLQDLSWSEKFSMFGQKYLYGLSPAYWFFPNEHDLIRHRMWGYFGHMRPEFLPFLLIGLGICLYRWRSSPHRAVVIALLATPFGAATVDIAITRVLAFVVPATILISLALDWLLAYLPERPQRATGLLAFAILSIMSLGMLRNALVEGPLWYREYGLFGLQYGAPQLFQIIPDYLEEDPDAQVMLTPTWANGTDLFPRFFLSPEEQARVQTLNVDAFLLEKRPLHEDMIFIMTPGEYQRALTSNKFKSVELEREFPYPDGSPGFYFVRLAYVDDVDAIFAAEAEARRRPVEAEMELSGQRVAVRHSLFDAGRLVDMFDDDTFTLARVMEANPALLEFTFPEPLSLSGIAGEFGTMDFRWTISLYAPGADEPVIYEEIYRNPEPDPHVEIPFDEGPAQVVKLRMELEDLLAGEKAKIHIRELTFKDAR